MASLAEYFAQHRYQGIYDLGDRVFGHWNKIPFVGTVGNDSVINELEGPRITVHLDLPIKYGEVFHTMIIVKHKQVSRLKELKEDDKGTGKRSSTAQPDTTDSKPKSKSTAPVRTKRAGK